MMCSVVVVVVVVIAVVAAAAQPFWKTAEFNVGPSISLTSDTAWMLSHINGPFIFFNLFIFLFNSGGRMVSLIRAENPCSSTIKHCHSLHQSPKSGTNHSVFGKKKVMLRFFDAFIPSSGITDAY